MKRIARLSFVITASVGQLAKALGRASKSFEDFQKAAKTAESAISKSFVRLDARIGVAGKRIATTIGTIRGALAAFSTGEAVKAPAALADNFRKLDTSINKAGQRLKRGIGSINKSLGTLNTAATATAKSAVASQKKISAAWKKMDSDVSGAGKRIRASVFNVRNSFIALGAAAVTKKAIDFASDFESALTNVDTLLDESSVAIGDYREQLLELSKASSKELIDLTAGLYQTISAGIPAVEGASGAFALLNEAQKAAVAGQATTEQAVDALVSSVNAYRDSGLSAADASDKLFTIVKKGRTTFPQLAANIGKVAGTAAIFGVSFDDMGGAIAALTRVLPSTEESMVALQAIILGLITPPADVGAKFKDLGIDLTAAGLKTNGLVGTLTKLKEAIGGDNDALVKLFPNVRALKGAAILLGSGFEDLVNFSNDLKTSTGETDKAYQKISKTFANTAKIFASQVQTVFVEAGTKVLPRLQTALKKLGDFIVSNQEQIGVAFEGFIDLLFRVGGFVINQGPTIATFFATAFVATKIAAATAALVKFVTMLKTAAAVAASSGAGAGAAFATNFKSAIGGLKSVIVNLLRSPNLLGLVIAAATVLGIAFGKFFGAGTKTGIERFRDQLDELAKVRQATDKAAAKAKSLRARGVSPEEARGIESGALLEIPESPARQQIGKAAASIEEVFKKLDTIQAKRLAKARINAEEAKRVRVDAARDAAKIEADSIAFVLEKRLAAGVAATETELTRGTAAETALKSADEAARNQLRLVESLRKRTDEAEFSALKGQEAVQSATQRRQQAEFDEFGQQLEAEKALRDALESETDKQRAKRLKKEAAAAASGAEERAAAIAAQVAEEAAEEEQTARDKINRDAGVEQAAFSLRTQLFRQFVAASVEGSDAQLEFRIDAINLEFAETKSAIEREQQLRTLSINTSAAERIAAESEATLKIKTAELQAAAEISAVREALQKKRGNEQIAALRKLQKFFADEEKQEAVQEAEDKKVTDAADKAFRATRVGGGLRAVTDIAGAEITKDIGLGGAGDALASALGVIAPGLAAVVKLPEMLNAAGEFLSTGLADFVGGLGDAFVNFFEGLGEFPDQLAGIIEDLPDIIGSIIAAAVPAILKISITLIPKLVVAFISLIKRGFEGLKDVVAGLFEAGAKAFLEKLLEGLKAGLAGLLGGDDITVGSAVGGGLGAVGGGILGIPFGPAGIAAGAFLGAAVGGGLGRMVEGWFHQGGFVGKEQRNPLGAAALLAAGAPSFQAGGLVSGVNQALQRAIRSGVGDDVPAVLQAGEAVISRQGVAALGEDNIRRANRGQGPLAPGLRAQVVIQGSGPLESLIENVVIELLEDDSSSLRAQADRDSRVAFAAPVRGRR